MAKKKSQTSKDRLVANGIMAVMVAPVLFGIYWVQRKLKKTA